MLSPSSRGLRLPLLCAALATILGLGAERAAATSLPYQVSLSARVGLLIGLYGDFLQETGTLTGEGIAEVGPGGTFAVPAGVIAGNVALPITDPGAYPIEGISLAASNLAGSLSATGGTLPLQGVLRFCLFGPCGSHTSEIVFPLAPMGVGGTATMMGGVLGNQTLIGAPWALTQTLLWTGYTTFGSAHGPLSSAASVFAPGGTMRLISGMLVQPGFSIDGPYVVIGELHFTFVPEPATALLVGLGAVGLAAVGRTRR